MFVARKLTFGPDIRLRIVRAVADVTVESALPVARESLREMPVADVGVG